MSTEGIARVLFLPGASGVARFWQPVIQRLALTVEYVAFDYPGFGGNPPDPRRATLADLTAWIETYVDRPVAVAAQSMGGTIGLHLALRRPHLVRRLVLTATSAGIPLGHGDVAAWREAYAREAPHHPGWLADERVPLAARAANLPVPCLLILGTRDAAAPPSVGQQLVRLLPSARLVTVDTDSHFFVRDLPDQVAPHIKAFLGV